MQQTSSKFSDNSGFGIGELSQRTGVNTVTLRAWERRYGLLKPERTAKGHRIYRDQHVERVKQITEWINRGVAVSKVKALLSEAVPLPHESNDQPLPAIEELIENAEQLSTNKLSHLLAEILLQYPVQQAQQQIITPAFQQLTANPAALALLDNLISDYCQQRLASHKNNKKNPVIELLLGPQTLCWPLAMTGLLLADKGYAVRLFHQPYGLTQWHNLLLGSRNSIRLFHQDGRWNDTEAALAKVLIAQQPQLILTGSAPSLVLTGSEAANKVFPQLQQAIAAVEKLSADSGTP